MKVRICYSVELDDWQREQISKYYGKLGKATRTEITAGGQQ